MTIITPTTKPLYWAVDKPVLITGITPIGGLTISGQTLISDSDPKLFLGKIAAFPVTKTIQTDEVGSVYKDALNQTCLVKVDRTIEVSAAAVEAPTEVVKVIK